MNILPIVPVMFLLLSCRQRQGDTAINTIANPADTNLGASMQIASPSAPCKGLAPRFMNFLETASLADSIAQEHFTFSTSKEDIPPEAQCWLDAIEGGHFRIADTAERWQCCCDRSDTTLPDQQLIGIAQSPHTFMIAYRTGGIAVMNHLLLIRHADGKAPIYFLPDPSAQKLNSLNGMLRAFRKTEP